MEELFSLVSSYGFPMVLSIYLLVRFEVLLKELKSSVDTLILLENTESNPKNRHNNYLQ
ncbi:MAG: YvrJ family protein [Candidatus Woesearchaeota archaeon]